MPRIPTSLLLKAYRENPLLLDVLKECRTLDQARNELRWLREGAISKCRNAGTYSKHWRHELRRMCTDRSRGKPLQYILGDQPFGDLEILCRPGVLIPRGETESYTSHASDIILKKRRANKFGASLRILDLCSGSGCISLLLHSLLASHIDNLTVLGVDVSPQAINLGYKNKAHNLRRGLLSPRAEKEVSFLLADILDHPGSDIPSLMDILQTHPDSAGGKSTWDVLISNPPYISPLNLVNGTTSRSVRRFEPVGALVPPVVDPSIWQALGLETIVPEDIFYAKLLSLARQLDVKLAVLECGDLQQAQRVVDMAHELPGIAGDEKEEYAYIWDDCYTTTDQDSGARAVILERGT
ncbi:hypothetical protein UA08_07872 [Talaromyces atroroseus]|uniref:Methyltransferase domain-containing protein n=1 Tax=Talaromyces atroroseus TaxID=1441469 RepID=A0A225AMV1_TALAT|nr:hypothetical protein UA08_07872 [Talaromyces atroroseus]OKL56919.1 hypothetical protein UA08_07872 [Talaromyces atroroseus]